MPLLIGLASALQKDFRVGRGSRPEKAYQERQNDEDGRSNGDVLEVFLREVLEHHHSHLPEGSEEAGQEDGSKKASFASSPSPGRGQKDWDDEDELQPAHLDAVGFPGLLEGFPSRAFLFVEDSF